MQTPQGLVKMTQLKACASRTKTLHLMSISSGGVRQRRQKKEEPQQHQHSQTAVDSHCSNLRSISTAQAASLDNAKLPAIPGTQHDASEPRTLDRGPRWIIFCVTNKVSSGPINGDFLGRGLELQTLAMCSSDTTLSGTGYHSGLYFSSLAVPSVTPLELFWARTRLMHPCLSLT